MEPLEAVAHAAEKVFKALDPDGTTYASWIQRARDLAGAPPEEAAAAMPELLDAVHGARIRALESLTSAEEALGALLAAAAAWIAKSPAPEPAGLEIAPRDGGDADVPPGAPAAETGPASATPAAGTPLQGLTALPAALAGLPVDPADTAFIPKSLEMLAGTGGDAAMEAKILYNCVWQLESMAERYGGWRGLGAGGGAGSKLATALGAARAPLVDRLEELGYTLFPKETTGSLQDLGAAVGKEALVPVPILSDQPRGALLGLSRSGVRRDGQAVEKAHVLVSAGQGEAAAILQDALLAILGVKPADKKDQRDLGRAVKDLWKYMTNLHTQPDGFTFARFAVNLLHDNDRSNRLKSAILQAVSFLERGGYQEIMVPLGDLFDDSFSPGKYERRRVPSDRPANTILRAARRGFLDPNGTPIQKAVVEVSAG